MKICTCTNLVWVVSTELSCTSNGNMHVYKYYLDDINISYFTLDFLS